MEAKIHNGAKLIVIDPRFRVRRRWLTTMPLFVPGLTLLPVRRIAVPAEQ